MSRQFYISLALTLGLIGGVQAAAVRAQESPSPSAGEQKADAPKPLRTLKDALPVLYWDAAQRGPLLTVKPEQEYPHQPRQQYEEIQRPPQMPPTLYAPADGSRSLRIEQVAPFFGVKPVFCGSLTVIVPNEMVVLATRLPVQPDPLIGMSRSEKIQVLQASLTPAQWRQLGSEQGLGAGDLDPNQRALFLSILPSPFRLLKGKTGDNYRGARPDWGTADPRVVLTDGQRSSVRIRLNRSAQYMLVNTRTTTDGDNVEWGTDVAAHPAGTERWVMNSRDNPQPLGTKYGVKIQDWVPNRLKQGQIDFAAPVLDAPIAVAGKKTVGDLIAAVSEKTGVELYVDGRAGKHSVAWVGDAPETVRTGDLLKALCWTLTGAFRKVGPDENGKSLYILSDDVEGIGARRARIQSWVEMGDALKNKLQEAERKKIGKAQPLQYVGFASTDPMAATASVQTKTDAIWKTSRGRYSGVAASLTELTPYQQEQARAAIARFQEQQAQSKQPPRNVFTDRVNVRVRAQMTYLVPGIGEVESGDAPWDSINVMLPPPETSGYDEQFFGKGFRPNRKPVLFPVDLPAGATLCLSPTTPDAAVASISLAKRRGFRQLWVQVDDPDSAEGHGILKAAGAAGTEQGVRVCAVFLLMRAPTGTPAADLDVNLLGETGAAFVTRRLAMPERWTGTNERYNGMGDWLLPDRPGTAERLTKRLREIAAIPGITGIVLRETSVTGYELAENDSNYNRYDFTGNEFGYTLANRLAMIRKAGYDPLDMSGTDYSNLTSLPNFSGASSWETLPAKVQQQWNGIRYEKQAALLKTVYTAFRASHPATSLYVLGRGGFSSWVARWDSPDAALPTLTPAKPTPPPTPPAKATTGTETGTAVAAAAVPAKPEPVKMPHELRMQIAVSLRSLDAESLVYLPSAPGEPKLEPRSVEAFSVQLNSVLRMFLNPTDAMRETLGNQQVPKYEGIFLDLATLPIADALHFVEKGVSPPLGSSAPTQSAKAQ